MAGRGGGGGSRPLRLAAGAAVGVWSQIDGLGYTTWARSCCSCCRGRSASRCWRPWARSPFQSRRFCLRWSPCFCYMADWSGFFQQVPSLRPRRNSFSARKKPERARRRLSTSLGALIPPITSCPRNSSPVEPFRARCTPRRGQPWPLAGNLPVDWMADSRLGIALALDFSELQSATALRPFESQRTIRGKPAACGTPMREGAHSENATTVASPIGRSWRRKWGDWAMKPQPRTRRWSGGPPGTTHRRHR